MGEAESKNESESGGMFYERLNLPENEKRLYQISFYIKDKIDSFAEELVKKLPKSPEGFKFKDCIERVKVIWPEFGGEMEEVKPDFLLPKDILPPEVNVVVRFERKASEIGKFENDVTIRLPLEPFMKARSEQEIKDAALLILQVVFHEVEHLEFFGSDIGDIGDKEELIKYLCDPGEVRAHAKQFAFWYTQEFPGKKFDIESMESVCDKSPLAKNYFIGFAKDEVKKKYASVDVVATHKEIINLTDKFVSEMI